MLTYKQGWEILYFFTPIEKDQLTLFAWILTRSSMLELLESKNVRNCLLHIIFILVE